MIKIDSKTSNYYKKLKIILDRRRKLDTANFTKVSRIIADIKKQKKKALIKYEIKYSKNARITLPKKIINKSVKNLNREIKSSIDFAYNRIMKFHMLQKKNLKNIYYLDKYKNKLQYNLVPIQTVGIYVPANLPSSLLMNAIPAKVSNVKKIILISGTNYRKDLTERIDQAGIPCWVPLASMGIGNQMQWQYFGWLDMILF